MKHPSFPVEITHTHPPNSIPVAVFFVCVVVPFGINSSFRVGSHQSPSIYLLFFSLTFRFSFFVDRFFRARSPLLLRRIPRAKPTQTSPGTSTGTRPANQEAGTTTTEKKTSRWIKWIMKTIKREPQDNRSPARGADVEECLRYLRIWSGQWTDQVFHI